MVSANMHIMNEFTLHLNVLVLIVFEIPQNKKMKFVQFALVYHLLSRSSSMTNFIKDLFIMLKVKHTWSDFVRWGKSIFGWYH